MEDAGTENGSRERNTMVRRKKAPGALYISFDTLEGEMGAPEIKKSIAKSEAAGGNENSGKVDPPRFVVVKYVLDE